MKKHKVTITTESLERFKEHNILFHNSPGSEYFLLNEVLVESFASFPAGGLHACGAFSYSWSWFPSNISVGRYCSIASNVQIMGDHHPLDRLSTNPFTYDQSIWKKWGLERNEQWDPLFFDHNPKNIIIENDVWIGQNVVLRDGVTISTGSVVAAGSVVTKDVPPYAIVGGNPAKIIRYRFQKEITAQLLASKWWEYHYADFKSTDFESPEFFLENFHREKEGKTKLYNISVNIVDFFNEEKIREKESTQ